MKGVITKIQRLSIHDGPGIRSVVFMKGCNMRCAWCHNPETFLRKPEIERLENKCIQCLECIKVCEPKALFVNNGKVHFDASKCTQCMECSEVCYSGSMHKIGEYHTIDSLFKQIELDLPFFAKSNGGVTFSGGEPLIQHQFLYECIQYLRSKSIHICIESNFSMKWETIEKFLPLVDHWLIDLKLMTSVEHKKWTLIDNDKVLQNIKKLDSTGNSYELRTPLIPSVNDNDKEIQKLIQFVSSLENCTNYQLNPYHTLGNQKYKNLGLENPFEIENEINRADFETWNKQLQQYRK
ncbi:glycyl-radical enzyme activating protein [Flammeovirga sp. MY04]|uniref:glycyl-radical enzyme activating protein n=1 Tax=Flammeovirga sp. MY04 TaxID=1191459 RepID=UPI000A000045|nr:glycyl-radical enzyme activating protein [Flammeovirga sp. MY04]ANQ52188.2 glycyl-radical enzyme activating protein [Flammeovirga sp. MY04]